MPLNKSAVALAMLVFVAAPRELTAFKYTCTILSSSPSIKEQSFGIEYFAIDLLTSVFSLAARLNSFSTFFLNVRTVLSLSAGNRCLNFLIVAALPFLRA